MANPYNRPTISGYNSNPPPDDGSQNADNEINWAKHKDKLGDPLKTFAEAIDSNVSSAFGKRLLNAVSSISSDYTVQTSDRGKLLSCSNTITITLLAAGTAGSGFELVIRNDGSGTVTVDGDGSETIDGNTTRDLNPKGWMILVSDGSNWLTTNLPLIDEDDMSSDSATHVPTQQSVKAYIDTTSDLSYEGSLDATNGGSNDQTALDFTGINSSAKRLTLLLDHVSVDNNDPLIVQIGDSGGFESTSYESITKGINSDGSVVEGTTSTDSFHFDAPVAAGAVLSGRIVLERFTSSGNLWVATYMVHTPSGEVLKFGSGTKDLSATLDRVRVTTSNGTANFDNGNLNIIVET